MKRHSKILPETFAKAISFGILDSKNITKEVVVEKCAAIQNGVSLSKQAIQIRLKGCIPFLKELLKKAFSLIYSNALENHSSLLLTYFTDIKILDATTISLPDKVAQDYPEMSGRNAKSALEIQTMHSVINHTITYFDITSGFTYDTGALTEMIQDLSTKELFLTDLGYFDTAYLKNIGQQKFFISRIKTNLKLFSIVSETYCIYERLNLSQVLKAAKHSIDQEVYIGPNSNYKFKVRLVGIELPEKVAHKRIKKAIKQNDGKDISRDKRELLHWNLIITNISANTLDTSIIVELYRLRW